MTIEIKVPAMGESVTEATISKWFKKEGDAVKRDEPLLELETDKVTVEVPSPADGAIESITAQQGATVQVGALLGAIAEGKSGAAPKAAAPKAEAPRSPLRRAARPAPAAVKASSAEIGKRWPCPRPSASSRNPASPCRPWPAPARTAVSPRATCWAHWNPDKARAQRPRRRLSGPGPAPASNSRRARNVCR